MHKPHDRRESRERKSYSRVREFKRSESANRDRAAQIMERPMPLEELKHRWSSALAVIGGMIQRESYSFSECAEIDCDLITCIVGYASYKRAGKVPYLPSVKKQELKVLSQLMGQMIHMYSEIGRGDFKTVAEDGEYLTPLIAGAYQEMIPVVADRDVLISVGERNKQFRQLVKSEVTAVYARSIINDMKRWSAGFYDNKAIALDGDDMTALKEIFNWMIDAFPREGASGVGDEFMLERLDFVPLDDTNFITKKKVEPEALEGKVQFLLEELGEAMDRPSKVTNRSFERFGKTIETIARMTFDAAEGKTLSETRDEIQRTLKERLLIARIKLENDQIPGFKSEVGEMRDTLIEIMARRIRASRMKQREAQSASGGSASVGERIAQPDAEQKQASKRSSQ
jgi:hypothetical protein